jgi:hypothetical protein
MEPIVLFGTQLTLSLVTVGIQNQRGHARVMTSVG